MTKAEVLEKLNCSQAALARMLGISRPAVAQWKMDKPIPERQLLRLKHEIRPAAFAEPSIAEHQGSAAA